MLKARRNTDRIFTIRDSSNNTLTDMTDISNAFVQFYTALLGTLAPNREPGIDGDKALGPDGYGGQFYKDCWSIVKEDVQAGIQEFFRTGKLLKAWNNTVITLVPKSEHAEKVGDYRTIACCNTSYKIISKVLSNRPRQNSPSSCLIRIDLKKAYNTVEWDFMEEMIQALNFPHQLIRWTMTCITTPQYTIVINRGLYGCIKGKRGLRQGDPISPLIFVICMEYFTRIMKVVAHQVGFEFHPKCRTLQLNHLCFANDVLLLSTREFQSVLWMLRGIKTFSDASPVLKNQVSSVLTCLLTALRIFVNYQVSQEGHSPLDTWEFLYMQKRSQRWIAKSS
ncbi:uncharacterized protein LOC132053747 [Lycium ferocissimum]|uniref:uncharacterized protein LOC132053747 n=1 Tax=Lycium ferocissimum TaxID=112874 RepID=UPI002814E2B4|nr:uncharacterized protein LOC132053747 [Lycium ferocissimum]